MEHMDAWDVALLAVAGYVAVLSLARLMLRQRDRLLDELRGRMLQEKRRKKKQQQQQQRKARQDEAA